MTVSVSLTCASFIVNGMVAFCPTSSSTSCSTTRREAGELGLDRVLAGRQVEQAVLAAFVGDRDDLAARRLIGGGDADAGQNRFGVVDGRADD